MAKFCTNCGAKLESGAKKCVACGKEVPIDATQNKPVNNTNKSNVNPNPKSKIAAGLLAIFLGSFGVHNFYLGYTNKAIPQLILGTAGAIILCGLGPVISGIWGFVEGIMILTGSINKDAAGNDLVD